MSDQTVTIVIPAFDEVMRLPATLDRLVAELEPVVGRRWDIVVSDDGSADGTASVVRSLGDERIRLVRSDVNQGKGAALTAGFDAARGEIVVFLDADLPVPTATLAALLVSLDTCDVAVGSRRLASSTFAEPQPFARRWGAAVFLTVVRRLGLLPTSDPQCGVKAMRREPMRSVVEATESAGFAFDIELLTRAREARLHVGEVPVHWSHVPGSTVRPLRDGMATVTQLLRVRRRLRRRLHPQPLPSLS